MGLVAALFSFDQGGEVTSHMHAGSATNQSPNYPETQKMSWTVNRSSPSTAWTKILGGAVKHYKKSAMVAPTAEAWKNIGAFVDAAMVLSLLNGAIKSEVLQSISCI